MESLSLRERMVIRMDAKRKNIFQASFPEEVLSGMPRLVWHGKERVMIEQHRGIVTCQENLIRFHTACGILAITGDRLEIVQYGPEDAIIRGRIDTAGYESSAGAIPKGRNHK